MNSARINVIETLQLVALKSKLIDLAERAEEPISIPHALLEKWEELYRPEQTHFQAGFSEAELTQLNCFTDFFLVGENGLPGEFSELLKDPYWNAVCDFAGQVLEDFSGAVNEA